MLVSTVRVSARELTSLILDEDRLRTERQDRKVWKSRVTGIEEFAPQSSIEGESVAPQRRSQRRDQRADEDDTEYRLAIEASKHEAEEERKRRERTSTIPDEDDLAKAIKLSKEEEELRRRELEETNASSLFDDAPAQPSQPQYTGYNQGYQQQGAVDWDGNVIEQQPFQQANTTGYLNNAYSNPTGFNTSQTGYSNVTAYPNGFQTSQDMFGQQPFQQQQQQQQQQQFAHGYLQPQNTVYTNVSNPYAQSSSTGTGTQYQQQQGLNVSAGSNNPWAIQPSQQQADTLKPMATGSNNPFASPFARSQSQPTAAAAAQVPSLNTLTEQKVQTQFNNHNFNPATSFSSPSAPPKKEQNPQHARLNALLAAGEGMDTFGNTGELRIPAQHTAPGTFVNSAGHNLSKLNQAQTGNNPFFQQQQQLQQQQTTTGFQQQQQQPGFGIQQQQNRFVPAQTGPATMNNHSMAGGTYGGQASGNPFGQSQTSTTSNRQPSGSLIDI